MFIMLNCRSVTFMHDLVNKLFFLFSISLSRPNLRGETCITGGGKNRRKNRRKKVGEIKGPFIVLLEILESTYIILEKSTPSSKPLFFFLIFFYLIQISYNSLITMSEAESLDRIDPSKFLGGIIGSSVKVKLHNGVEYQGDLQTIDGYMNVALENGKEVIDNKVTKHYGDVFLRGNNGMLRHFARNESLTH